MLREATAVREMAEETGESGEEEGCSFSELFDETIA